MEESSILDKGAKIIGICAIAYGSLACLATLVGAVLGKGSSAFLNAWFLPMLFLGLLSAVLAMISEGLKNREEKPKSSPPKNESEDEKP